MSAKHPRYAVIIPVCNEEACLEAVLEELGARLDRIDREIVVAVGLNDSSDGSGQIAAEWGALTGETPERGYGHGCRAAIGAVKKADAYIFFSGDGANDPADLEKLIRVYENGAAMVIGTRTTRLSNWRRPWIRSFSNVILGFWASVLAGQIFWDLGPFRVIDRRLFEAMRLRELTWGWTIEAQIAAARMGARIAQIPVRERGRIAGRQKVSGVSPGQTLAIGGAIIAAGWRARFQRRGVPDA